MTTVIHWVVHVLGLDTQSSAFYMFWSGCGSTMLTAPLAWAALRWEIRNVRDSERWHGEK